MQSTHGNPTGGGQAPADRYNRLSAAWKKRFGQKVQKVTLRAGFSCPNRDGRIGEGGCIFCSEESLLPKEGPIFGPLEQQLEAGLSHNERNTGAKLAITYFQDGTATDGPIELLTDLYRRAIDHDQVVGLAVGTRPDWITDEAYALLADLNREKPVWLELGLQTASDRLLRAINRGHSLADFEQAVEKAHQLKLEVVAHVILDLPGETPEDRRATAACLNRLGVGGVKIHNLHILRGTQLASSLESLEPSLASLSEYANMAADFIQRLDPEMIIHRLTGEGPADLMLAPAWGRDKRRILSEINRALIRLDTWQGKLLG